MKDHSQIIIDDFDGILPYHEVFYLESIQHTATRALDAFNRFNIGLQEKNDVEGTVNALQEALGHSAAVSRYFWPIREKGVTPFRGQKLRQAFNLSDDSPLRDSSIRHAIEHFDERLDAFLSEGLAGMFYPNSIVGSVSVTDDVTVKIFRLVDPGKEIFILLGNRYKYSGIEAEVQRILHLATQMSESGGTLRSS
jgi:hypothetical protein